MPNSRQIVWIYAGDSSKGEVDQDYDGDIPIPPQGGVVERNGARWAVVKVDEQNTVAGPKAWPVFRVYLRRM
jgi:hypothetical protein